MKIINTTKGTMNPYYELLPHAGLGYEFFSGTVGHKDSFLAVTDEQADAFERVIRHQGVENYVGAYYCHLDNIVVARFNHIVIAIETDGYTHS